MVQIPVYDAQGQKVRDVELDVDALDGEVRQPLLKEALLAYLASQRQGTHKVKTRAEVRGGSNKPFRQKGTGRARQGCVRAPHYVGGGRAHGPLPRDYGWRLPVKQRRLACRSALRFAAEQQHVFAVEGLDGLEKPSTRTVQKFLDAIGLGGKGVIFVSEANDGTLYRSARNIPKTEVVERRMLNAGQILQRHHLVFTAAALEGLIQEVAA